MLYFAYRAKVLFARKHYGTLWFPLWYAGGLAYAVGVAPWKFQRMAQRPFSLRALLSTQRALLRAFLDGLRKGRIQASDYRDE